jgi:gamma-polyglutamate biosynthesis protein CapA
MVKINFVGDIMLGDSFHMLGIGVGSSLFHDGTRSIFEKVSPFLAHADINVGNLECTFSIDKLNPKDNLKPYISHSSDYVQYLKNAGFHILNLANNHTMQYGENNFAYTEQFLINNGIKTIGTIRYPFQILYIRGIKIAFVGYSLKPNEFKHSNIQYIEGSRENILSDINLLANHNNHVVVLIHWGDEYIDYPDQAQVDLAHDMISAGAALIVGHHPHILQGIEYFKTGVIAYSLGNFVFDKPQILQRKSLILEVIVSEEKIDSIRTIPIYIDGSFQPLIATGKKKKRIEDLMNNLNKKIMSTRFSKHKYERDVIRGIRKMRFQFYMFLLCNFYRYPPWILIVLIKNAIVRRLFKKKK